MAQVDLPLDELRAYRPAREEPEDFDAFWASTLADSRAARRPPVFAGVETHLRTLRITDVTFSGYAGQPIRGWLLAPAGAPGPLPTIVEFAGYGGGRGTPLDRLLWRPRSTPTSSWTRAARAQLAVR
jgi:cephalosporin-C deacetylase